jgi:zinc/manganese transport system substrate-binding protein
MTEPLMEYLVEDSGYRNITPSEFSDAVEEDRDISPAVLEEATALIKSGSVGAILLNSSTQTAQIAALLAINPKIPNFAFSELLLQDPDTLEYDGGYFEMLDAAIDTLVEQW